MPSRDHPRSRGVYGRFTMGQTLWLGSSPLARGLRHGPRPVRGDVRIIPARAGFTGSRLPLTGTYRDHPRSRGVYDAEHIISSPPPRIIPARAGFTPAAHAPVRGSQDHPRSRGVYKPGGAGTLAWFGSSPLARGLPVASTSRPSRRGSSPLARGLPPRRPDEPRQAQDHPRSRGVYQSSGSTMISFGGSSPLARGLPLHVKALDGQIRIIPARAGFTGGSNSCRARREDHPRSRGVYAKLHLNSLYGKGSSPLARGLHAHCLRQRVGRRIIPARAGFTRARADGSFLAWDHPRSRGVYEPVDGGTDNDLGSSPLARGLRVRALCVRSFRGIIPARAGFTAATMGDGGGQRDHPRSRGVYAGGRSVMSRPAGSSPLARGLLLGAPSQGAAGGIIPARAGFTARASQAQAGSGDHPRSRGVYHVCVTRATVRPRIIPARAGFTWAAGLRWHPAVDHPRSRGVYTPPPWAMAAARGIIPARAGFTVPGDRRQDDARDHPRSRGVYLTFLLPIRGRNGSSPLARGLLHDV